MMTSAVNHYCRSSIGRKYLMAITGLLLCGFLVGHLAGNFLLLVGPDAFNLYAHKLTSLGSLLYVIEAILALIFIVHLSLAIRLTIENKKAAGKFHLKKRTGRGATFMSATMPYTGIVLLIFLILHLMNLKFGEYYSIEVDGIMVRDLYRTTLDYFKDPINVAWYVFSMICAGLHTAHGFASAFQSLGGNHPKYFPLIKKMSYLYAIVVSGGFTFISVWVHLMGVYYEL